MKRTHLRELLLLCVLGVPAAAQTVQATVTGRVLDSSGGGVPNTPAIRMEDSIAEEQKSKRLALLMERQRQIQSVNYQRHLDQVLEVMVEGRNEARGQMIGRSSQNKTVNFTSIALIQPAIGSYVRVQVTKANPNSLVGEMLAR